MEEIVLKKGNVITPDGVLEATDVVLRDGVIALIGKTDKPGVDCTGMYITPGFIDMHTHGGYGSDFMDCTNQDFDNALRFHIDNGTTTVLATSVTASVPATTRFMDWVRTYHNDTYADIYGVHLEGPYLSIRNKGAQKEEYILNPQTDDYSWILDYKDVVKTVTISPERDVDGKMTKTLTENGILVCGGHDDGIYPEFMASVENGLKHMTHLYCAMSEVRFKDGRRNVGLREYCLLQDNLTAEIIADNRHIPPELAALIFKCKGRERLALVSDSLRCAGMPIDGKLYRLGTKDDDTAQLFKVADGVAVLADGTRYAGSITPVRKMVQNLISAGIGLVDAVRCGTVNPANFIGATDRGRMEVGCRGDVLVLDAELNLVKIYKKGKEYKGEC